MRSTIQLFELCIRVALSVVVLFFWGSSAVSGSEPHHTQHRIHIPDEFVRQLAREIYNERQDEQCGDIKNAPLLTQDYYGLSSHRLLVFVGLPDYLCYSSNSFVPFVADSEGNIRWGERMDGRPALLAQDQSQTLWLVTQWAIEASYPSLYTSDDGIEWKEVPLPEDREIDCCFEFLNEVCVQTEGVRIRITGLEAESDDTFEFQEEFLSQLQDKTSIPQEVLSKLKPLTYSNCGELTDIRQFLKMLQERLTDFEFSTYSAEIAAYANKIQYWQAPFENITENPHWEKEAPEGPYKHTRQQCESTIMTKGEWLRQENSTDVQFLYPPNGLRIIFPKSF